MTLVDFDPYEEYDLETSCKRREWWQSMRSWFAERGYFLYHPQFHEGESIPLCYPPLPFPETDWSATSPFPYAYRESHSLEYGECGENYLSSDEPFRPSGVWFAQDRETRLVAVKLVKKDTEEYRILRRIDEDTSRASSFNNIIPILEFIDMEHFSAVVMPKWSVVFTPDRCFETMRDVLSMIHCLLKGLVFLHDRNTVHRDIKIENTLVNHAHNAHWTRHDHTAAFHRSLRRAGVLTYAYIDFDIAIIRGMGQTNWAVKDTAQGEHDYDPFTFDVALPGFQFCQSFQHLPPYAPCLAPLLDMMVTHDYKRRFTASEALKFFEDMYPLLPEEQLQAFPPMLPHPEDHETFDRWKDLPPDLTKRWASYREPPLP
ncbi:kinase-like domain-containing protein [Armillaria borealis]|uniref:Kinase-like domain-containing protein n=1 Tax=Armillaria borealis TaxID=47425 RepID=A0AA39JMR4_9AGAR|nr:kinase-like domain-containing protein [Armillaria borealis]